jgi:hypothetical protein
MKWATKDTTSHKAMSMTSVNEKLKGKQNKIDANKNGKIDAEDFKMLRKK